MATDKIEQTNEGLARYYTNMGVQDYNDKFKEWCADNDYDDEGIADEFDQDPTDAAIVDFDDQFPVPMHDDQKQDDISRKIFNIIKRCWDNADAYMDDEKTITSVTKLGDANNFVISSQQKLDYQKLYAEQCPSIYHSGTKEDKAFLTALIVGRQHNVQYLQHLFDFYMRASVREFKRNGKVLQISDWAKQFPYFNRLNKDTAAVATGATKSFGARICPHLLFNTTTRIQDSLEDTTKYICEAVQFVKKLANKPKQNTCPFQVDVCIAFPKTISTQVVIGVDTNDDESDDDDEDVDSTAYDARDDEKSPLFFDRIGNITSKLESNGLKYSTMRSDITKPMRVIGTTFDAFSKQIGVDQYPAKKRFVTIIDRRKEDNDDEIIMYEPPPQVKDIPHNAVPEWYLNASKTCILPNIGYEPKIEEQEEDTTAPERKEEGNNFNINSLSSCGGALLTLSFHVKQSDSIKCYLYLNGQICRFFADDVLDVLPLFFDMEFGSNSVFSQDEAIKKKIDDEIRKDLPDREFNSFKRVWERDS